MKETIIKREDFIHSITNVSFLNDSETKQENINSLMGLIDEKYLFACGDIFTKIFEDEHSVQWACQKSFYEITLNKDCSDFYYGEAILIPLNIGCYE